MKSKQLRYEMKLPEENDWNEVSETAFMKGLLDCFYPVTPVIIKMLRGREVAATFGDFRIILKPNAKGFLIPGKTKLARAA